ncbi:unnamed protein product, partial [Polarella glacialis]
LIYACVQNYAYTFPDDLYELLWPRSFCLEAQNKHLCHFTGCHPRRAMKCLIAAAVVVLTLTFAGFADASPAGSDHPGVQEASHPAGSAAEAAHHDEGEANSEDVELLPNSTEIVYDSENVSHSFGNSIVCHYGQLCNGGWALRTSAVKVCMGDIVCAKPDAVAQGHEGQGDENMELPSNVLEQAQLLDNKTDFARDLANISQSLGNLIEEEEEEQEEEEEEQEEEEDPEEEEEQEEEDPVAEVPGAAPAQVVVQAAEFAGVPGPGEEGSRAVGEASFATDGERMPAISNRWSQKHLGHLTGCQPRAMKCLIAAAVVVLTLTFAGFADASPAGSDHPGVQEASHPAGSAAEAAHHDEGEANSEDVELLPNSTEIVYDSENVSHSFGNSIVCHYGQLCNGGWALRTSEVKVCMGDIVCAKPDAVAQGHEGQGNKNMELPSDVLEQAQLLDNKSDAARDLANISQSLGNLIVCRGARVCHGGWTWRGRGKVCRGGFACAGGSGGGGSWRRPGGGWSGGSGGCAGVRVCRGAWTWRGRVKSCQGGFVCRGRGLQDSVQEASHPAGSAAEAAHDDEGEASSEDVELLPNSTEIVYDSENVSHSFGNSIVCHYGQLCIGGWALRTREVKVCMGDIVCAKPDAVAQGHEGQGDENMELPSNVLEQAQLLDNKTDFARDLANISQSLGNLIVCRGARVCHGGWMWRGEGSRAVGEGSFATDGERMPATSHRWSQELPAMKCLIAAAVGVLTLTLAGSADASPAGSDHPGVQEASHPAGSAAEAAHHDEGEANSEDVCMGDIVCAKPDAVAQGHEGQGDENLELPSNVLEQVQLPDNKSDFARDLANISQSLGNLIVCRGARVAARCVGGFVCHGRGLQDSVQEASQLAGSAAEAAHHDEGEAHSEDVELLPNSTEIVYDSENVSHSFGNSIVCHYGQLCNGGWALRTSEVKVCMGDIVCATPDAVDEGHEGQGDENMELPGNVLEQVQLPDDKADFARDLANISQSLGNLIVCRGARVAPMCVAGALLVHMEDPVVEVPGGGAVVGQAAQVVVPASEFVGVPGPGGAESRAVGEASLAEDGERMPAMGHC